MREEVEQLAQVRRVVPRLQPPRHEALRQRSRQHINNSDSCLEQALACHYKFVAHVLDQLWLLMHIVAVPPDLRCHCTEQQQTLHARLPPKLHHAALVAAQGHGALLDNGS
jgi:hypothetical protein